MRCATSVFHGALALVVTRFRQTRTSGTPIGELSDEHYTVFYDAAWELARIGVLRPGRVAPRNMETANDFGDHWSITKFGFEWLARAVLPSVSGHGSHVPSPRGLRTDIRSGVRTTRGEGRPSLPDREVPCSVFDGRCRGRIYLARGSNRQERRRG
jgi:hypothetical protein